MGCGSGDRKNRVFSWMSDMTDRRRYHQVSWTCRVSPTLTWSKGGAVLGDVINTRRGESFQMLEIFFIDTIIDQGIETPMGG
jgi:hypothetical protein